MKKIVLSIVMIFNSIIGFSQFEKDSTENKLNFGFNLGGNYSLLKSKKIKTNNLKISNGVGFRFGILMNYKLNKSFLLSTKAELSFNNNSVLINEMNNPILAQFYVTDVELMTHFIYKRRNLKLNPYILIGPNVRVPLYSEENNLNELSTNLDFAIDVGIGLEKKLTFFNLMPELRFSTGLTNIIKDNTLPSLYFHNITLILNFVG